MADSQVRLTGAVAHPEGIEREFGQGGRAMVWLPRLILLTVTLTSVACHTGQVGPDPPPAIDLPDEFPPGPQPAGPWAIVESFDDDTLSAAMTVWSTFPAEQPPPSIVEDSTALGGRALQIDWTGGTDNHRGARVALPGGMQPVVHVRFRYKLPPNATLSGLLKLIQFLGPEDQPIGSLNIVSGQWMYRAEDVVDLGDHLATGSTPAECLGRWCWIEASMDYSAETSGRARVWINGVVVLDYTPGAISYATGIAAVQVWGAFPAPAESRSEWIDELAVGATYRDKPLEVIDPEVYFAADFTDCSSKARVGKLMNPSVGKKGDAVAVTRTNPYPLGLCSAEFTFGGDTAATSDAWAEWRFRLTRPVPEVWAAWSAYFPGPGDVGKGTAVYEHRAVSPNNNKLLRLWDEDYNKYRLKLGFSLTAATLSNIISEYGTNGSGVGRFGSPSATDAITSEKLGRWIRFVAHVKTATATNSDGMIELWQDGVQVISNTALPMYPNDGVGNYLRNGYLLGWANSGFAATTKVWLANVIIASTRALTDSP